MKKKLVVFILLFSFLFFNSCSKEEQLEISKNYNLAKVQTWTVSLTDSYISYAEWIKEIPVST